MELWDLYNEKREPIGRTHRRGEPLPDGFYHLVIHVWIRNSKGEYLISQRSETRPTFPLMWECVGGSALSGENSMDAALRETKEEVGISLSPESGRIIHSVIGRAVDSIPFPDILDVWLFDYTGEASLRDAATDEVAQSKWMSSSEIQSLLSKKEMVHTLEYFFHLPLP